MSIVIPESNNKIRRNTVNSEFYDDEIKEAVLAQVKQQLIDVNDESQAEGIKRHFLFLLANDFYKDELRSNGGRVLNITSTGKMYKEIRKNIFKIIKMINWKYGFYRKDIGWRVI